MRLKKKPIKPERTSSTRTVSIASMFDGLSLEDLPHLKDEILGLYPGINHRIHVEWGYEYTDLHLIYTYEETDESLWLRIQEYEKKLKEYVLWYKENKEAIDQELRRRKLEKQKRKAKELELLKAKQERLNNKINKLQGEM